MGMTKTVVIVVVVVGLVNWLSHEDLNAREKRQRQGGSLDRTPKLLLTEMHAVIYEYAAVTGGRSAVTYMSHTAVK